MKVLVLMLVGFMSGLVCSVDSHAFGPKRSGSDPATVMNVDLNRYAGLWYEVAHSPNFFQRKCKSSTAEYKVLDAQSVSVFNTCYKFNAGTSTINGVAKIVDPTVSSKLKVVFQIFTHPKGDYWITELDPEYQWAVVSGPGKGYNFILSRTAPIRSELKESILATLKSKGYNIDELYFDQYE